MAYSKHTEAQMTEALKQLAAGRKVEDVALEIGVTEHTIVVWQKTFKLSKEGPQIVVRLRCSGCGSDNLSLDVSRDILVCANCGAMDFLGNRPEKSK